MRGFDARRATGFTRWLLRQRRRNDPIGTLARTAREDSSWPYRGMLRGDFITHLEHTGHSEDLPSVRKAWDEYLKQSAGRGLEIEVDWGSLSKRLANAGPGWQLDDELGTLGGITPQLRRLVKETQAGDRSAARELLLASKRRADIDTLRLVRNFACRESDWPLLCEVLACGSEEILRDTFKRARQLDDRYVMDRTIELGSPSFLRELYAEARLLESADSLHIALAVLKALMPEQWQAFLPDEFHHGVNVTAPDARFCEELPALPE